MSVCEASLSSLLITPFPSPGSSLTSSCASSYQRRWLRSQTTSLENGVFPRWWGLDASVQTQCETKQISDISIYVKMQQTFLKLSVRVILLKKHSAAHLLRILLIFVSLSSQGFSQAFVKFILKGLPQDPASSWENNTCFCQALITTHEALWPDMELRWAVCYFKSSCQPDGAF